MNKAKRQETILKIIENNVIVTQDDLQNALLNMGIEATQSTVSRDIKDLRIIKALDKTGTYRYVNPLKENGERANRPPHNHYSDVFRHAVISINSAMNDVVIKCYPGMASSACVAVDNLFGDDILGSLAGDDTIFVITKDTEKANNLVANLKNLL